MLFFHQLAGKWKRDDKTFHEQSQSPSPGVWECWGTQDLPDMGNCTPDWSSRTFLSSVLSPG